MLLVDDRTGSKDLLTLLQQCGTPCELQHLEFGDFAFIGRGLGGKDLFIGVELKRFGGAEGRSDLLHSMHSKRFAGRQLIGLQGYDRGWLITEGIHRASHEGALEIFTNHEWKTASIGGRYVMLADVHSWLLTQITRGGVSYWHCPTRRDTARFLTTLYRWWTDKDLDKHRSHEEIYQPPPDRANLVEPSTFVKMAANLPHVGWEKAFRLEASGFQFRLMTKQNSPASVRDLQAVSGIGKTIAGQIITTLDRQENLL